MSEAKQTVFVGMSGGVDSSVSALLLKEQGYQVVGVYMKNWSRDLPGMKCPWAEDLADAKRVAVKLDIDFQVFDFENQYREKVVDYMLAEFKKGHTPNPDIMCNQEIKFKLFYDVAMARGADFIATGHYAQTDHVNLLRAVDDNKDQTYFLYRISPDAIAHTLFPVGNLLKPEVKKIAENHGLANAYKKESMGVCFVGEVGMTDFLKEYIDTKAGDIIDADTGKVIGVHEGAIFYTIGQRHGLNLGGGLPYYVVDKNIDQNIVYVSRNLSNSNLWTNAIKLQEIVWRGAPLTQGQSTQDRFTQNQSAQSQSIDLLVRIRHRAPLIPARLQGDQLFFQNEIKSPAVGQSVVFYQDEICLGGGIISP